MHADRETVPFPLPAILMLVWDAAPLLAIVLAARQKCVALLHAREVFLSLMVIL